MEPATFYVNAPLSEAEHKALAEMARVNGRAKGQELRAIAVAKLRSIGLLPIKTPMLRSGSQPKPRRTGK